MHIREITSDQAHQNLQKVNSAVAEALMALESHLPDPERSGMTFAEVTLGYNESFLENGQLQRELNEKLSAYTLPYHLPVGIVTHGSLEIFQRIPADDGRQGTRRTTTVTLDPGSLVGIFEALQHYLGRQKTIDPGWNIVSGATTIYSMDAFTDAHRKKLRKSYQDLPDVEQLQNLVHIPDQMFQISELREKSKDWVSKIIILPRIIFETIYGAEHDAMANMVSKLPTINLRRLLVERAWPSAFRAIDGLSEVFEYFEDVDVAEFCRSLIRLNRNEKVLFTFDAPADHLCPHGIINSDFLAAAGMKANFLAPTYLKDSTQCGFLPIKDMLKSKRLPSNKKKLLDEWAGAIRKGLAQARRSNESLSREIGLILGRIVIKLGKGGNSNYFKVDPALGNIVKLSRGRDLFWRDVHQNLEWEEDYVPTNTEFFSFCIRLDK